MDLHLDEDPHRRWNPLLREYCLVSPHRAKRPWTGQTEPIILESPRYDPKCYLCPGNVRVSGLKNDDYETTFVFVNDYRALLHPDESELQPPAPIQPTEDLLFRVEPVLGECRVICYSPRHDLTLARMSLPAIRSVIDLWVTQFVDLSQGSRHYKWVQIFENRGGAMGCSNPHPHGQIWAGDFVPTLVKKEDEGQRIYRETFAARGGAGGEDRVLLADYLARELEDGSRVVFEGVHWVALVPFWAVWPFETMLLPKDSRARRLTDLSDEQKDDLAAVMKNLLVRYDNLFKCLFPYSMGWHQAPGSASVEGENENVDHWLLHAHLYPPLLRSASVKKFMVGYELLSEPQRDITAEEAARRLRELSGEVHFLEAEAGDVGG